MKKRTLAIILIVVLALAGLWLARGQAAQETVAIDEPQVTSCLIALDEVQQSNAVLSEAENDEAQPEATAVAPDEDGAYTTKDDVAAYIAAYGTLPDNFMTKDEARGLGWSGGGLDEYSYGMCIGGDRFGNYEGLLPEASGRQYYECDVNTLHADERGAERIVFSNDGLVYYTDDHYESFTLLYGTP
jgi:guanyl-specific ribonuclease Sa